MNTKILIEGIGYLGSALVVVSMLMTSVVKLRIINMIGCIIFTIYALIIKSYPTAVMNLFLVGINIVQLLKLGNTKKHYSLVRVDSKDGYLDFLFDHYKEDIRQFFPDFEKKRKDCDLAYAICCDTDVAGLTLGKTGSNRQLEMLLDYTTPVYRDCSVGRFLYGELKKEGFSSLSYTGDNAAHIAYVERMGFEKLQDGRYVKKL